MNQQATSFWLEMWVPGRRVTPASVLGPWEPYALEQARLKAHQDKILDEANALATELGLNLKAVKGETFVVDLTLAQLRRIAGASRYAAQASRLLTFQPEVEGVT